MLVEFFVVHCALWFMKSQILHITQYYFLGVVNNQYLFGPFAYCVLLHLKRNQKLWQNFKMDYDCWLNFLMHSTRVRNTFIIFWNSRGYVYSRGWVCIFRTRLCIVFCNICNITDIADCLPGCEIPKCGFAFFRVFRSKQIHKHTLNTSCLLVAK